LRSTSSCESWWAKTLSLTLFEFSFELTDALFFGIDITLQNKIAIKGGAGEVIRFFRAMVLEGVLTFPSLAFAEPVALLYVRSTRLSNTGVTHA
jgi:hypothetical protein